ncbi:MAG TPA: FG-GAP-like repeat-containing protein [Bryobacteraceae bacterium]|nr:FG-GAP-like repeat-containing protein [Bryobacteraceae bacterium]
MPGGTTYNILSLLSPGNAGFGQPVTTQTSAHLDIFAMADLNGDGIPDAVMSDAAFLLGHKDGSFSSFTTIPAPAGQCLVSTQQVADFDNDGKPDILAATQSGTLILFLNQGGGNFSPLNVTGSSALLTADFNGDGIPDLLVQNPSGTYSVLLGKGAGAFQPPVAIPPLYSSQLFSLDINGDGKADMVQAIGGEFTPPTGLEFYISNGDGTFQKSPLSLPGFVPLVVADFNGDGLPDFAAFGSNNDTSSATLEVLINTTSLSGVTGAVNGASFAKGQPLTAGALVSVFGNGFASANAPAQSIPLPLNLGGVSVTVGGVPAPLQFVSSGQINLQVPWEITGSTADIVVTANGTALPAFHANIAPVVPGIFTTQSGVGQAIAINQDGSLAGPENSIPGLAVHPAKAGDVLQILATGLGAVSPPVADGANASDGLRNTAVMPTILIGGVAAPVSFSGLAPLFVGVNQINVTVPQVSPGVVPLQIQEGGITTSNQVTIAVTQ